MKKFFIFLISILLIIGIACGIYYGIDYFKYRGNITSSDSILKGQISYDGYFLTSDNTVRDTNNTIYQNNISFLSQDGLMVDSDGNLLGFNHVRNVKDVKIGYFIDNNDTLYQYTFEIRRRICDNVKFVENINENGEATNNAIAVTSKGEILLESNREDTDWFSIYVDSLSFGQKINIAKISVDYYIPSTGETKVIIYTLFNNGKLHKSIFTFSTYYQNWIVDETENEYENMLVKDFIFDCNELSQTMFILTSESKVFIKSNDDNYNDYSSGKFVADLENVKGIYNTCNTLFAIKDDNSIYTFDETLRNKLNMGNVYNITVLDYIFAKTENNTYLNLSDASIDSKYEDILNNDCIDYEILSASKEYAYVTKDNKAFYYDGKELTQIEGEFQQVFFYSPYFYFIKTDGSVVSTHRFADSKITSLENVKDVKENLILYNDGTLGTIKNSSELEEYIKTLSDIKEIGYDKTGYVYWFKNSNNRIYVYLMYKGDIDNLVSIPTDNDWTLLYTNPTNTSMCFYSEKENKNYLIKYNSETKEYELSTPEFEHTLKQVVRTYILGDTFYCVTTENKLLRFSANQCAVYGIKLIEK